MDATNATAELPEEIYNGPFGTIAYCKAGRWAGWIFTKHVDGQWVSLAKIPADTAPHEKADVDELKEKFYQEIPMSQHGDHAAIERYNDMVSDIFDHLTTNGYRIVKDGDNG